MVRKVFFANSEESCWSNCLADSTVVGVPGRVVRTHGVTTDAEQLEEIKLKKLTATIGAMHTDRGFGPFNGDRYELGSRHYYIVNYPLTPEVALQAFYTHAFDVHFPITIKQRFDFVATYNPTAYLKRKGVF